MGFYRIKTNKCGPMGLLLGHEDMDGTDFPDSIKLVLKTLPGFHSNNNSIIQVL